MAYTYDDFKNKANQAGLLNRFSQADLDTAAKSPEFGLSMLGLMQDEQKATTAEQRLIAQEAANQLRKNYGVYTTGTSYAPSYGSKIDALTQEQAQYPSFSYDAESDPSYVAYKKMLLREGERASANALAKAAAASGGQVSSYAMTAAQQASNNYAAQIGDVIPELEQAAYGRHMDGYNQLLEKIDLYRKLEDDGYQKYLEKENLAYRQRQEALAREQQELAKEQEEYDRALAMFELTGELTPEMAKVLGLSSYAESDTGTGSGGDDAAMSMNDWYTARAEYNQTGTGPDAVAKYSSYGDYITAYRAGNVGTGQLTDDEARENNNLPVDTNSVMQLGFGPINAQQLDELVDRGIVEEYIENGVKKFRRRWETGYAGQNAYTDIPVEKALALSAQNGWEKSGVSKQSGGGVNLQIVQ